ncbi:unnamed protein product [Paramecium pentaurelia]|uniref:Uncharacterized protein n=1 Tax=Paramecium pentaurelia TaxID=43138 RepID=A0A8S1WRF3_9CILI|nr:unnamed protein product [Paramecium pentaurelia]
MNQGDNFIEELLDGFRISECQSQGNESAFKNLLSQVKENRKQLSKQLYQKQPFSNESSQQGSTYTQFSLSRQSFNTNEESVQCQIEKETIKQNQLQNVIVTILRKITDYKKHTDSVLELLQGFNKDDEVAQQEGIQSNQLLQQSKKNAVEAQEYHQLLKNAQDMQKQILLDKHQLIQQEIKELQNDYIEYRLKYQQKIEIIQQQKQVIADLDEKKAKIQLKQQEQSTVIYYANTIKLLDEMINKDDPRNLFQYQFEQRQQIIRQNKKLSQSQAQSSNAASVMNIFTTQIEQVEQEILESPKAEEKEKDLKLLELIKSSNNQLNELDIQQDLLAFADIVIQNYQEYKEYFDRLGFQFIQLNEKKFELQQIMRETNYCKYPETSNGLLPLKLSDNYNNNQITLNILSTSVELDLNEQRNENEVKRIQNAVIRLFNFMRNHVARVNHLIKHIQELSELVPSTIFIVLEQLKNSLYINEIIRTPTQKKPSMLATTILEQKQEFVHVKHAKLLSQKQMLNTVHIPKKHVHASITKFKYLQIVQKFIKSLLSDEIERLFIQQDMVDELTKEVQKYCEENDPDEEALMRYLGTKKMFFQHHLQQRTRGMLKNALSKLGEIHQKLKFQSQQLRLKGLDFTESKFKSGCAFNSNELQMKSCQRTTSNHFVSSQQSFDNVSINHSEHSKPHGGKDVFHLLKKLTNVNDMQEIVQQDSEDSIDKERDKLKKQQYFIKSQVNTKNKTQKNLDDDVFYRLNPQRQNPNKELRNQLGILRHMRIGAARSSCSIDQEMKSEIWKMTCPVQPSKIKTRKDTFRKLFNSSDKKQVDLLSQKKIQTRSFQTNLNQLPRNTYTSGDDAEAIWKKKYRAKKILNAISVKESQKEKFGFLEVI